MGLGTIINLLLVIGAVHGFIFIGITFFLRKKIEKPVLFLNLFVLFLSLNNLQSWLLETKISHELLTTFFTAPWYLMIVPMFYSFLLHYLEIEKKKNPLIWISSGLFLMAVGIRAYLILGVRREEINISVLEHYNLVEDSFALIYSITLFFLSVDVVKRQQRLYPEILNFDNLQWIKRFLRLGGLVFILWTVAVVLNIFSENIKAPESYYPLRLVSSVLIYWVAYQAFFNYRLLKDRVKLRKLLKKKGPRASKVKTENFTKAKVTFQQFEACVLDNQAYLNPNLGLETVANELNVGVSTLSKVINENGFGFSEYVNSARVKEAQRILNDPEFNNYTIVAIGLECGFNSKSTFYSAFKKVAGISPSEFRNL